MNKWEDDIRRYLNGEMSPEEQHALEKKALHDPFLYEALEGAGSISEKEFSNDLNDLTTKLEKRTKETPAEDFLFVAAMRSAAGTERSSTPKVEKKTQHRWFWPLRIAASITLLLVAYFSITPLFNNKDNELAQQKPAEIEEKKIQKDSINNTIAVNPNPEIVTGELKAREQAKSKTEKEKQSIKPNEELPPPSLAVAPVPVQPEETDKEIIEGRVADVIEDSPVVVASEIKKAEPKIEPIQGAAAKRSIVQNLTSNQKIIQGKVVSAEDGTPLPGVNIVVKGTTIGTVTDMQGNYQLISDSQEPTLVYSFIGLQSQEIKATDQKELNVLLQSDVSQLSEVVVTGYSPVKNDGSHEPVIKLAEPAGGRRVYDKYLKNSLQYPQQALENKIKGRVTIQFTVLTDGSLSDFSVFRGLGFGCDEEVIRLVKEGPKWSPTTEDNVAVESEVRVRVKFALPD